jgi:hypothetical protein
MDIHDIRHVGEESLIHIEELQQRIHVSPAVLVVQVTDLKRPWR